MAAANAVWNCAADGVGGRVRIRLAVAIGLAVAIAAIVIERPIGQSAVYYVDVKNPGCSDAPGFGSESKPYCKLRYVSTIAAPGDTFLIKSGRYGDGPETFRRSGTATAPITYRAIGDVVIGVFDDVRDEDFQPTPYANVYAVAWTNPLAPRRVHQTYFGPIVVDDPTNLSIFTMKQEDGPLALSSVTDDATLAARDGTWRYDATTRVLYCASLRQSGAQHGEHRPRGGLDWSGLGGRRAARVQHLRWLSHPLRWHGLDVLGVRQEQSVSESLAPRDAVVAARGNNYVENMTSTHVIARGSYVVMALSRIRHGDDRVRARGTSRKMFTSITLECSISSSDGAPGLVIDGLRMHGAPNHCGTVGDEQHYYGTAVLYNCQDYFYLNQTDNVVIEHAVSAQGIALQGLTGPVGKVTVRNSILSGNFGYTSVSKPEHCAWESGSLLENSVISECGHD